MLTLSAEIRKNQGKGASRRLRFINKLPAIMYGGTETPLAIELEHDAVLNNQIKEGFYSDVLVLIIEGKENRVKVQAVQRHPFKPKLAHIDFMRI